MILAPCQTATIDFRIENLKYNSHSSSNRYTFGRYRLNLNAAKTINDIHSCRDDYIIYRAKCR